MVVRNQRQRRRGLAMKTSDKNDLMARMVRWEIPSIDLYNGNYFQLYHWQQMRLGELAELFGIKPSNKGWSRAQTLFERLKKYENNSLPF